jgi:hypothetical protein
MRGADGHLVTQESDMNRTLSLKELEHQAEVDGSLACELGDRYRKGDGVQQDSAMAFHWYSRGAAKGDRDAQNNLGTMFLHGLNCQADKAQAINWYFKSAEQGNADAQWNIGKRYLHGDGIERNYTEAYQWFSKAAVQGCSEAYCEMGTMHRLGHGVHRNLLAAADFHLIAADRGDALACDNLREYNAEIQDMALSCSQMASLFLCRMYNRGFGVEKSQALTWTWILWSKKNCQPDTDAEIVEEVAEAYDFYRKHITSANRKEGERMLAMLREDHSKRANTTQDPAPSRSTLAKRSGLKAKRNGLKPKRREPIEDDNNAATPRWLRSDDNPVGIDILDCRAFARTMMSVTSDQEVAVRFSQLRSSLGYEIAGSCPERARAIQCSLDFPLSSPLQEGPLFKAEEMEDKWDIYLFSEHLYFCRSWTGALISCASVTLSNEKMVINAIETNSSEEDDIVIQQVVFLIWSHVFQRLFLHPLPKRFGTDVQALTTYSFSEFGRRGWYGTMQDTIKLSFERQMSVENLPRLTE